MSLDSTKVNISKEAKKADDLKVKKVGDDTILVYTNRDGEVVTEKLPGNLNRKELELLKKPFKEGKVKNKPANPGDAGESIVKLAKGGDPSEFGMLSVKAGVDNNPKPTQADRIVGATKKMKKGGIVKKKPSRTRIAKRGFGIAKRGY